MQYYDATWSKVWGNSREFYVADQNGAVRYYVYIGDDGLFYVFSKRPYSIYNRIAIESSDPFQPTFAILSLSISSISPNSGTSQEAVRLLVNFSINENCSIQLYDEFYGQVIYTSNFNAGNNTIGIDLSDQGTHQFNLIATGLESGQRISQAFNYVLQATQAEIDYDNIKKKAYKVLFLEQRNY